MINPQEQRIQKILELLEDAKVFTPQELEAAEEYLSEEEEQEAGGKSPISSFPLRDLASVSGDMANRFAQHFRELESKGRKDLARKLADILFAAGRTSGNELFPYMGYTSSCDIFSNAVQATAMYGAKAAGAEYQITAHNLKSLIQLADNQQEVLRQAIECQHETPEGELFIAAAYFYMQYPDARLRVEEKAANEGKSTGIAKALELQGLAGAQMTSVDAAILRRCEDITVNSIKNLFNGRLPDLVLREIENALRRDEVDGRILGLAKKHRPINRYLMRLLGGTAYVSFALSPCLRNVAALCFAADPEGMLGVAEFMDIRGDIRYQGGNFDLIFGLDPKRYINWAGGKRLMEILKAQFQRNRQTFMVGMEEADFDTYNLMSAMVKELDPSAYAERKDRESSRQQGKVVGRFVEIVEPIAKSDVKSYLTGEAGIETLYACENSLIQKDSWRLSQQWQILESYQKRYGNDDFSVRCEIVLIICRCFARTSYLVKGGKLDEKRTEELFDRVNKAGLALRSQLDAYSDMWEAFYSEEHKKNLSAAAKKIFRKYLEERPEEMTTAFRNAASTGRSFGIMVLGEDPLDYKDVILGFAQDSSKAVKEELLQVLYERKEWEEDIQRLLASKKAADREVAIRVLAKWDDQKYKPVFEAALEKEKNGKVRTLLETVLKVEGGEKAGGSALTQEDLVKEMHKGGKKRALAWAYETPFSKVHKKTGEEASEEYLQAIFLCYSSMSPLGVSPGAKTLAEGLKEQELAVYANELFDKWLEGGAESKKRWVLYAAAIHGGADIVNKLQHQIQEWPQAARGAIASEAVQALALNPLPQALLVVDGIARKFKFKQVRAAAGSALDFAASQLGITTEELADRIVPNLGFDENMERIFDYGGRKFTVTITTALEIEVFDESGKKLKNLPAPGKRDEEEKAAAAYEEFKLMKKQMKVTVSSQKMRLEMALSTGRLWSVEAWRNLFVKNPVMHQFAIGLIWGVYENHELVNSFRYMEDGSFNTEDEEEFQLPEEQNMLIGLVHPIEMTEDSLKTWKEQLEDYEIAQPIEQLDRQVYYRTQEEQNEKSLERFGGVNVNDLSLSGKLLAMGWYRGSVQDGGGFYSYYREDKELSMGVELHFSGSFVGGFNEDVTVYETRFYKTGGADGEGGIKRGSYVYDEANDSNSCFLKEVPERYFSEVVLQLSRATAASKERNENWKKKK